MLSLQAMEQMLMLMLMLMMMMAGGAYGQTVCHAVATDQVTTVACLFGRDVSQHNFNVQFFPTPDSDPDLILVCNRRSSSGLMCKKGIGVDFDEDQLVTTQLILTAPPVNDQQTGQYLCQVGGVDGHLKRCNVNFQKSPETVSASVSPLGLANIVLCALCLMALIIGCLVCYLRKERIKAWFTKPITEGWPGALDGLDIKQDSSVSAVQSLPQYFFNMGKEEGKKIQQTTSDDPKLRTTSERGSSQSKRSVAGDVEHSQSLFKRGVSYMFPYLTKDSKNKEKVLPEEMKGDQPLLQQEQPDQRVLHIL